jgi:hypothetical protein
MDRCSICHTLIKTGDEDTSCPECQQRYHRGCWQEIGGCATYGCRTAAVAQKPPPPTRRGSGWGDEKTCPACKAQIPSSLLACRCRARFPWADPITPEEYQEWLREEQRLSTLRKLFVALFLTSLVGYTAPLCGGIAGVLAFFQRKRLAGANGAYLALGCGTAAIGATYGILVGLLALGL